MTNGPILHAFSFADFGLRFQQSWGAKLGSIVPHKRVELIITAIGRVPPPRPDLVWIANAPNQSHQQNLQQLALQLMIIAE